MVRRIAVELELCIGRAIAFAGDRSKDVSFVLYRRGLGMSKQMFTLPLSALEKWLRAPSAAERIVGPTAVRVVEEQIATKPR